MLSFLIFPLFFLSDIKLTEFWSVKGWFVRKCFQCLTTSIIALASFSTDECFSSDPWRVLEKNATSLPFWFKTAAEVAMSEASVSNSNGWDSSMAWLLYSMEMIWILQVD